MCPFLRVCYKPAPLNLFRCLFYAMVNVRLSLPQLGVCTSKLWRSQQTKFPKLEEEPHISNSQSQLTTGRRCNRIARRSPMNEDGLGTMQITSSDGETRNVILGIRSSPGKAGWSLSVSEMEMDFHRNSTLQRDFHRKGTSPLYCVQRENDVLNTCEINTYTCCNPKQDVLADGSWKYNHCVHTVNATSLSPLARQSWWCNSYIWCRRDNPMLKFV